MWNARCIQKLLDFGARESKESHQLGWLEESRREPARIIAGNCRRAAASASASASPAAAGASAGAAAGAALSGAGATTASSIAAAAAAAPTPAAALSVEVGVVRDQMGVETSRLGRRSARAGVDAAESKSVEPRRRGQFLEGRL
jgi:hypothetical protein